MARPEKEIDYTVREVGILARYLRALRTTAGLTYTELAQQAWFSQSSLKRAAAGGTREPRWDVVCAYASACGGLVGEARALYETAKAAADAAARDARRSTVAPKPQFVRDEADLSGAMRDAYRRAGRPPVRQMERQAGPGRLPSSTAHAIITARALPKDVRTYIAFLETCEITGHALIPWFAAWIRACGSRRRQRVFSTPSSLLPAEQLFIDWFNKRQEEPPAHDGPAQTVTTGPHRFSPTTERQPTPNDNSRNIAA
ncbi:helix-turn-helix domain-containing protein [Streptomyces chartreusis]|uniref:helix-turn-helix domain-containing protein n=1 Tax=Streptomyces chartreusis TaxID=1969 RepID=UPI0037F8EFFC